MKGTHCFVIPLVFGLSLTSFLTAGCASQRTSAIQADHTNEKAQIQKRLQEVMAACEAKDFERLDSYHLYGPKFTKFTGSSPVRLDAAAGKEGEHKGLGGVSGLKMHTESLKIDVFGEAGIATFVLDYSFQSGGQTLSRKERTTLVFVRDSGEWKIAHEHLSPIKE